jgi:hypothetical protein
MELIAVQTGGLWTTEMAPGESLGFRQHRGYPIASGMIDKKKPGEQRSPV